MKCPHLNCLVYHPDGNCTCKMERYCHICKTGKDIDGSPLPPAPKKKPIIHGILCGSDGCEEVESPKKKPSESEAVVNIIIERLDDVEELSGADFTHAKRIILQWAKEKGLFVDEQAR